MSSEHMITDYHRIITFYTKTLNPICKNPNNQV